MSELSKGYPSRCVLSFFRQESPSAQSRQDAELQKSENPGISKKNFQNLSLLTIPLRSSSAFHVFTSASSEKAV
jgi:hypothetical protein